MSTQANEPEGTVKDGVEGSAQRGEAPVAREEGPPASPQESDATANQASAEGRDSNKVPGPAEEQDEKTPDDRGLTTDSSPD
ncbi:MAG: hypothetical protein JWO49_2292 [Arthrobacter sp.]|nr:hypothetical protein [Arthrobacter sp.]MCU1547851.1 hypothetical protein [Arthrobacter sp.]